MVVRAAAACGHGTSSAVLVASLRFRAAIVATNRSERATRFFMPKPD